MSKKRKKRTIDLGAEEAICIAELKKMRKELYQQRVDTLKKEPAHKSKNKGGEKKKPSLNREQRQKERRTNKRNATNEIIEFLRPFDIGIPHTKLKNQPELTREQSVLIEIDFDGLYFTPKQSELSGVYKTAKQKAQTYDVQNIYQSTDFDLNQIPCWEEMKKFNSFRPMQRYICRQLSKIGFNPSNLNQLEFYDVIDLIALHNRENPEQIMIGQRTRFLKMFAACYGEEFVHKMSLIGQCPEEKQENEQLAKNFLTYVYFLDNPNKKAPKECAKAANYFSVHHVQNRKYANELEDYSLVNNFSNLVLCISNPLHSILHNPIELDINRNLVFFGGLLKEFRITRDPAKERDYENNLIKEFKPQRESR